MTYVHKPQDISGDAHHPAPLASVIDALPEATLVFDLSGSLILANSSARELLGENIESLRLHVESKSEVVCQTPTHPNGIRLSVSSRSINAVDGAAIGSLVIVRPTSSKSTLHEILNAIPVPALELRIGSGQITFANAAADKLADGKFPRAKSLEDHERLYAFIDENGAPIPPGDLPTIRIAQGERLEGVRASWQGPSGPREVLISGEALPRAEGQLPAAVILLQDLSALKQAETDLALSQKESAARSHEMQQFAYAAAHDLQEPLRSVSSYLQLLSRRYQGKLDSDATEYIQFALDASLWMGQLIRDLLTFSRAGNPDTLRIEEIDFRSVVQYALLNLDAAVKESGIEIEQGPLPTVTGDQARLAMMMQNLIANAIKFRSAEHPKVRVSSQREGDSWVFCVADNGSGFDPKYAGQIFEVFKRLCGREVPGTGIGLAIAKKIVEIHNGRMWAESNAGQGSKFYFTLPAS